MAVNKGMTFFVLLLYYCHEAEQPMITYSGSRRGSFGGPAPEIPPRSETQKDMPDVFGEMLVQQILGPNRASRAGTGGTAATLPKRPSTEKSPITDENFQVSPKGYHELSDDLQFSLDSEDKIPNKESGVDESFRVGSPEGSREPHLPSSREDRIFNNERKNGKIDQNLSVLDKILQNIRKVSGTPPSKWKTSEAPRTEDDQSGHQLRKLSKKQEILAE